jgi:hypothetical protein
MPITDIHAGVITSSLGSHSSEVLAAPRGLVVECTDADSGHPNDHAHLVTRGSTLPPGSLFAAYGGAGGTTNLDDFTNQVSSLVRGVGEDGCGFEAQLEAVYRFLIDPNPPVNYVLADSGSSSFVPGATDAEILNERKAFLRPDSLVIVVVLTDEDDCSISDIGNANVYLAIDPVTLENPLIGTVNDPLGNQPNLRCFHQKQRFGADGMWPVQRYIDGFSKQQLNGSNGPVDNPLYVDATCPAGSTTCTRVRDPRLVIFATLTGVPWQDVTRVGASGRPDGSLGVMNSSELAAAGRWDVMLGNPDSELNPTDPFMIQARVPRVTGSQNPISGDAIASVDAAQNATINGHEWQPEDDLEFACTFPLGPILANGMDSVDCTPDKLPDGTDGPAKCDCAASAPTPTTKDPICQAPPGTTPEYGVRQYFIAARPAVRQLQVAKALGAQSVVGSICAGDPDPASPSFGDRPFMRAILDRVPR